MSVANDPAVRAADAGEPILKRAARRAQRQRCLSDLGPEHFRFGVSLVADHVPDLPSRYPVATFTMSVPLPKPGFLRLFNGANRIDQKLLAGTLLNIVALAEQPL